MITCEECRLRMKPDDPRVRSGKYNRCGCDFCDKPSYYIEIEKQHELPEQEEFTIRQWDYIQQIKAEVLHYRKEHATLMLELDKKTKKKGIKYK